MTDFNYVDPSYTNIEIDITYKCNLKCSNCDRMANMFEFGDTDMSLGQIYHFIHEVRHSKHKISKITVIGGEPLIHPKFLDIWFALYSNLLRTNIIDKMLLIINGIKKLPPELAKCNVVVSPPSAKNHKYFYIAPIDINAEMRPCCNPSGPKECGVILNTFGYFPCGAGGSIARLFNLNIAKHKLPDNLAVWDFNQLCIYCTHANSCPERSTVDIPIKYSRTFQIKIKEFHQNQFNFPKYPSMKLF